MLAGFPQRPNGTTGWVRADDLSEWGLENRIEVSLSERTLRVLAGETDEVLFEATVSVGSDATPTPLGDYFIDIVNPLGEHPTYGWGQLSVSAFSDVLETFAGGIGQIAIHGWNRPADMGRNVSNGCVRMNNDDIARVAELSPIGTPVRILP
jgi:lipoprotein-anchoring transpeptidase ErfK/SrfK